MLVSRAVMAKILFALRVGTVASHALDAVCIDGSCPQQVVLLQTGLAKATSTPATAAPTIAHEQDGPVSYGDPSCKCIGIEMHGSSTLSFGNKTAIYPTKTGTSCQAWDCETHPDCKVSDPPSWCHDSWCYVDPCTCSLDIPPKKTTTEVKWQGKPAYWSYATCGHKDTYSASNKKACVNQKDKDGCSTLADCAWNGKMCVGKDIVDTCKKDDLSSEVYGKKTCRCVGFFPKKGNATLTVDGEDMSYPASLGGKCDSWDKDVYPECQDADPPSWCSEKWCYVDPCDCTLPDSQPKKTMSGAKYQGKPVYWSYGTCGGKDTFSKDLANLPEFPPAYCPASKAPAPESYGNDACKCIGVAFNGSSTLSMGGAKVEYPTRTGTSCHAWDDGRFPDCQSDHAPDWCEKQWCYVDPCNCDIATPPKKTVTEVQWQGKPAYWSYATCGATDTFSKSNKKACVNKKDKDGCATLDDCAWTGTQCVGKDIVDACEKDDLPEDVYGTKACRCVGFWPKKGFANISGGLAYPASVGGKCDAWDMGIYPGCTGDNPDDFCSQKWCYVDPCSCQIEGSQPKQTLTGATLQGNPVYWSYGTCGGEDKFTEDLKHLPKYPPAFCPGEEPAAKSAASSQQSICFGLALVLLAMLRQQ